MNGLHIFNLLCWTITGVIVLCRKTMVTKFEYFLAWLILMIFLLEPILTEVL
jgi:hypothetical protein